MKENKSLQKFCSTDSNVLDTTSVISGVSARELEKRDHRVRKQPLTMRKCSAPHRQAWILTRDDLLLDTYISGTYRHGGFAYCSRALTT